MHIKMNTGLSGPLYCLVAGDEIAFDENFPFGARELGRHIAAGNCAYVGEQADLDAWIAANPDPEPDVAKPALYGSSAFPAIVEIEGFQIQLGGIVNAAFATFVTASGGQLEGVAAIEAWNALAENERDALLTAEVDELKAEPTIIADLIAETSIIARPAAAEPAPPAPVAETPPAPAAAEAAAAPKASAKAPAKAAAKK